MTLSKLPKLRLVYLMCVLLVACKTRATVPTNFVRGRELSASQFMRSHKPIKQSGSIPKIFHQTWKVSQRPSKTRDWLLSCRTLYPDWDFVLWSDQENTRLIAQYYTWFLETFMKYDSNIKRADAVRYFILHRYGGVYMDLDFICLKHAAPLFQKGLPTFGIQYTAFNSEDLLTYEFARLGSIANAWMASQPGDLVFDIIIDQLTHSSNEENVLHATGPHFLTKVLQDNYFNVNFSLVESTYIYSQQYNTPKKCLNASECRKRYPMAYFATFWTATWLIPSNSSW